MFSIDNCKLCNRYIVYQDYHSSTTEYFSGDWFDNVGGIDLKQEPHDVCCVIYQS